MPASSSDATPLRTTLISPVATTTTAPTGSRAALARMIGHEAFVSLKAMEERARKEIVDRHETGGYIQIVNPIESYMSSPGTKFVKRFDANSYLRAVEYGGERFDLVGSKPTVPPTWIRSFGGAAINASWCFSIDSDVCYLPGRTRRHGDGLGAGGGTRYKDHRPLRQGPRFVSARARVVRPAFDRHPRMGTVVRREVLSIRYSIRIRGGYRGSGCAEPSLRRLGTGLVRRAGRAGGKPGRRPLRTPVRLIRFRPRDPWRPGAPRSPLR